MTTQHSTPTNLETSTEDTQRKQRYREYFSGLQNMTALMGYNAAQWNSIETNELSLNLPDPEKQPTHTPTNHDELNVLHQEILRRVVKNIPGTVTLAQVAVLDPDTLTDLDLTESAVLTGCRDNPYRLIATIDSRRPN